LHAQLDDLLEEAPENLQPVALADLGEAGVLGQRFVEIVAQVPADTEAISNYLHQLALGPQSLEENHGIDAGATKRSGIAVPN
jgi:hypothetical protein